jgi:PPOX class probable F420-dependent enzyme
VSRRKQIQMDEAEIADFLEHRRVLNVATLGPTGHPHLVAMWYVMRDGNPTFWTFSKSQKIANIRRDARISALVESGDVYGELKGVEVRGTARLIHDVDEVLEIGKAVGLKYTGPIVLTDEALPFLEAQATKRTGVVIDVEVTTSWDHRKLDRI